MDKEKIQKRLDQLINEREVARNNYLAIEGAISDCQYWLKEIENAS